MAEGCVRPVKLTRPGSIIPGNEKGNDTSMPISRRRNEKSRSILITVKPRLKSIPRGTGIISDNLRIIKPIGLFSEDEREGKANKRKRRSEQREIFRRIFKQGKYGTIVSTWKIRRVGIQYFIVPRGAISSCKILSPVRRV